MQAARLGGRPGARRDASFNPASTTKAGVREYRPAGDIVDDVWCRREAEKRLHGKVTSIEARRGAAKRDSGARQLAGF